MLVDHRTYRVKPGTMQAHLDLYEKHGLVPQVRHLGEPLAYADQRTCLMTPTKFAPIKW